MIKSTKPSLWLALFLLTTACTVCRAQDTFPAEMRGPADLRNQRPYQLLFLAFSPEPATVLDGGRSAASVQIDIANDLLIPQHNNTVNVYEDTETQRAAFKERRGLGHGLEASISVPVIARDAGILDKLIADYHNLIGDTHTTPDDATGRGNITAYHSRILLTRADGTVIVDAHPAAGIGDIQGTIKQALWSAGRTAGALRAGVKLPTGSSDKLIGSGAVDTGIDFDTQATLSGRLTVFGNISCVWMQKAHDLDSLAQRRMRHGAVAVEYYTSSHSSWVLQNDISDAGVRTGNAFADGNQATIALAYKYSPNPHTLLTYGFTEKRRRGRRPHSVDRQCRPGPNRLVRMDVILLNKPVQLLLSYDFPLIGLW